MRWVILPTEGGRIWYELNQNGTLMKAKGAKGETKDGRFVWTNQDTGATGTFTRAGEVVTEFDGHEWSIDWEFSDPDEPICQ
jgi:hypothetical protein